MSRPRDNPAFAFRRRGPFLGFGFAIARSAWAKEPFVEFQFRHATLAGPASNVVDSTVTELQAMSLAMSGHLKALGGSRKSPSPSLPDQCSTSRNPRTLLRLRLSGGS